jgi:hypothetical protein
MRKVVGLGACLVLLALFACGRGRGPHSRLPGYPAQQAAPQIVPAAPLPLELPGTVPAAPADAAAALVRSRSAAPAVRRASAVLSTITAGSISTSSPPVGGVAHAFCASDGNVWVEAQDTAAEREYHVSGTVNSLALAPDGMSYATLGLCTWLTYDYALNQASPPNSAYLFNQNLYLLVRHVADDGPGLCRVRLGDFNGKTSGFEAITSTPFTYDLQLNPTNPIVSAPPSPPYTDHVCGVATFSIDGTPIPGSLTYGDDNWGWRTAAGPERYDAATGGALLLAQVYASGNSVTSAISFDATFSSGPLTNPPPDGADWFMRGRDTQRDAASPWPGPQGRAGIPPGVLWQQPVGDAFLGGPVLGPDGTVYLGNNTRINAFDPVSGMPRPGWPVADAHNGFFNTGTPAVGPDGTVYAVASNTVGRNFTVHAWNPDGSGKWPAVDFGSGGPSSNVWSGLLVFQDRLYFGAQISGQNRFFVYDAVAGAYLGSVLVPDTGVISTNAAAVAISGDALYWNTSAGLHSFDLDGHLRWNWQPPAGASCLGAPPCVAPDGTIFIAASDHRLYALRDNGTSAAPSPAFNGGSVDNAGSQFTSLAIDDRGGGDYRVYTRDAAGDQGLQCFNPAGSLQWHSLIAAGSVSSAPAVGSDGKIYLAGSTVACVDPADGSAVWQRDLGGGTGLNSPALDRHGSLFVVAGLELLALQDTAAEDLSIDCRALAAASFSLFDAAGSPLSGTLDTDVLFDASGSGLVPGSQFYLAFSLDQTASPSDVVLYPPRPDAAAGGVVTVGTTELVIAPSLEPYFTNPAGTLSLVLKPAAYNRIGNDLRALSDTLYTFGDIAAGGAAFSPPLPARTSGGKTAVLAAGTNYGLALAALPYPLAGADPGYHGAPEEVYPPRFASGGFLVGFATLAESGAMAGPDNDLTDFYDQAGLVNILQPDAYCRFEAEPGAGLSADYGCFDATAGSWIIIPGFPFGREPQARPHDTFAFARGTVFQVSDGGNYSDDVAVEPGRLLNGTGYPGALSVPLGLSSLTLRPLPVRVVDDPAQADPGQPGAAASGSGPWTVPLEFLLQYGNDPWTIDLDADYGASWDDGTPGRVYAVETTGTPGLQFVDQPIPAAQPPGTYSFAIRVTDAAGYKSTFVWPQQVTLSP